MRTVEMLRDLLGKFPFKSLFISQLYVSGDRFHYFLSAFWVKLLSSQVYARSINRVRFSCLPVILTWELKSVTHDFSAHPVKLTVLVTAFLRILYPLGGVTAYLGKMCFIALEGTQQISLWLIALIFLSAGFVLPMIAPCFCLVFHA